MHAVSLEEADEPEDAQEADEAGDADEPDGAEEADNTNINKRRWTIWCDMTVPYCM